MPLAGNLGGKFFVLPEDTQGPTRLWSRQLRECGNHELDGAVGEDHNDIAIGDASVVELVGQYVGRLIDLFVGEMPRRSGRRSRLRDAGPAGVRSSIFVEDVMDSPNPAAPVEMDGRIPLL